MLICQLTDLHVRPAGKPANRVSETNMFTERSGRWPGSTQAPMWWSSPAT